MSLKFALFLFLLGFCFAQEPPITGEADQDDETENRIPGKKLQVDPEKIVVPEGDFLIKANITPLEAAKIFEKASGKRAILSKALVDAVDTVSFTLGGPLTNAELAKFLQLTLLAEGVAIIPVPGEPTIVRLVPSGPITSHGSRLRNLRFFDEANLPDGDEIVMFIMTFKNIKPAEALKIFQATLGEKAPSGTITAVPNASSLIITEKPSFIRKMVGIKKVIDSPKSHGIRWVSVGNGEVEKIAARVREHYDKRGFDHQKSKKEEPRPGSESGDERSSETNPLRIVGDPRTSRILLVGPKADLIAAETMIQRLDQPVDGGKEK